MVKKEKMDFWIAQGLNVLFVGKHGTGKTTTILDAFKRNGLNYLYFSGSTMDPFIDFCGVPIQIKDAKGNSSIELVLPKHIDPEKVEAIFIDEYNRTLSKIRNATMELIQFKSINGKKFPKLKVIWAAINPEKEEGDDDEQEYDVEALDPAQRDRFQVQVEIPYECDRPYFASKFGADTADAALEWWRQLDKKLKNKISPRRLDYAISHYVNGGELKDILPKEANIASLSSNLSSGSVRKKIESLFADKKEIEAIDFLKKTTHRDFVEKIIQRNMAKYGPFFIPLMTPENFMSFFTSSNLSSIEPIILNELNSKKDKSPIYETMMSAITSNLNKKKTDILKSIIKKSSCADIFKKSTNIKKTNDESSRSMDDYIKNTYSFTTPMKKEVLEKLWEIDNADLGKDSLIKKLFVVDLILSRFNKGTLRKENAKVRTKIKEMMDILCSTFKLSESDIKTSIHDLRKKYGVAKRADRGIQYHFPKMTYSSLPFEGEEDLVAAFSAYSNDDDEEEAF